MVLGSWPVEAARNGDIGSSRLFRLGGSAEWEFFRSDGQVETTQTTLQAFRQRYSLTATGAIYDFRFNRYALTLDFFRADLASNDRSTNTQSLGYRASTTFFPNRPFPLRLYARKIGTDAAGNALADSNRENSAWGAEWVAAISSRQNLRALYDHGSYDLTTPLALEQRTSTGLLEYSLRTKHRETSLKYDYQESVERVSDSGFQRQDLGLIDRTTFGKGMTLLFNAYHTLSDARFSTGVTDELEVNRIRGTFDIPRRDRLGFNLDYDYYTNVGQFVDSKSQTLLGRFRIRLADHWESDVGGRAGRLDTVSAGGPTGQDLRGWFAGLRYNRDFHWVFLGAAAAGGQTQTLFDTGEVRLYDNRSAELDLRIPYGASAQLFARGEYTVNENDATGVGYTMDQRRGELGSEFGISADYRGKLAVHLADRSYDTFQFGVQDSREVGAYVTVFHPRGSLTLSATSTEGISQFIPDPASGNPFLPGPDLVNHSDIASVGFNWKGPGHLTVRFQGRYANREFTSIGQEYLFSYHPEVEWAFGAWRLAGGVTRYERQNSTSFRQDTFLVRLTRLVF